MLIVYDSRTGNVEKFVKKIDLPNIKIKPDLIVDRPFILITFTTGFGIVPETTIKFLEKNYIYLKGVAASGNLNWGNLFAHSADIISQKYNVPIIHKFELSGTQKDVEIFKERLHELEAY